MKELPPWLTIVMGLIAGCFAATVFAYSNFVTVRERDTAREITMKRIDTLESGQKDQIKETGQLAGKIDSLILMVQQLQQEKNRR